jgi:hypothetical protein
MSLASLPVLTSKRISRVDTNDISDGVESALVLRGGSVESPPLALPARTQPGPQEVRVQGLHYEVKIATLDHTLPGQKNPFHCSMPSNSAHAFRRPSSALRVRCRLYMGHGLRDMTTCQANTGQNLWMHGCATPIKRSTHRSLGMQKAFGHEVGRLWWAGVISCSISLQR